MAQALGRAPMKGANIPRWQGYLLLGLGLTAIGVIPWGIVIYVICCNR